MGWWQLELPYEISIYKIEVFPSIVNYSDFYDQFIISFSIMDPKN